MEERPESIKDMLNTQTGKLEWHELERHFARGVVIKVAPDLDLLEVGEQMVSDNKQQFEAWTADHKVVRATEEDAKRWYESKPVFWAVVVAPWVLVQESYDAD